MHLYQPLTRRSWVSWFPRGFQGTGRFVSTCPWPASLDTNLFTSFSFVWFLFCFVLQGGLLFYSTVPIWSYSWLLPSPSIYSSNLILAANSRKVNRNAATGRMVHVAGENLCGHKPKQGNRSINKQRLRDLTQLWARVRTLAFLLMSLQQSFL